MKTIGFGTLTDSQREIRALLKKARAGGKRARKTLRDKWHIRVYTEAEVREYELDQKEVQSNARPRGSRNR